LSNSPAASGQIKPTFQETDMSKFMGMVAAIGVAMALAGCGSTPGDKEVREAMMNQMIAVGGKQAAEIFKKDVDTIKVISCAKSEPSGFKCDWTGGMMGASSGRIIKGDSGWMLVSGGG
jgi:hypothetical protein